MARGRTTAFFCKECGYESAKWMGQCPGCRQWNTMVEQPLMKKTTAFAAAFAGGSTASGAAVPSALSEIAMEEEDRTPTGMRELDRVLGGGIVSGSLILVGGDPGIGKSTLLLQVCRSTAALGKRVLYISGEESLRQIKMRANRIGTFSGHFFLLAETNLDRMQQAIEEMMPDIVIVDSIQTMYREDISSAPGSVGQIRESTNVLLSIAKGKGITIFLVGHVTKEGVVAGPRVLEHMVDTVLYFEGDRNAVYRILRAVKNRFGSTNEIGVFEMRQDGLQEVENPSQYMLSGRPLQASGSVVTCAVEGTRPLLLEIQALICQTGFGMPRRTAAGADYNRLNLLLAVLEKRVGMNLSQCDAYLNITGGIKVSEPALDLGIVLAVMSSFRDSAIDEKTIVFGEVGLAGEVRAVSMAQQRVNEAVKLGFQTCVLPEVCMTNLEIPQGIRCIGIRKVGDLLDLIP